MFGVSNGYELGSKLFELNVLASSALEKNDISNSFELLVSKLFEFDAIVS